MMNRTISCLHVVLSLMSLAYAGAAQAQAVTTITDPFVPIDFERGRNKSVTEDVDPHFRPVGVRLGGFNVFPSITVATGITDNVYVNNANKVSDVLWSAKPQVQLLSNWSRHSFSLNASADVVRYSQEKLRNREEYIIVATGRIDVSSEIKAKIRLNYQRFAETPFLSELSVDASVLSQYSNFNPSASIIYESGQSRLTAVAERYSVRFNTVDLEDGSVRDQKERNRNIDRFAVQGDYALTPSAAVYLQANIDHANYLAPRTDGSANRDGDTFRVIGGFSLDLAGLLRGKVGAGWTKKTYDAPRYSDAEGLTVDSSLEFFVSPLTTVKLTGRSSFQDINNNVTTGAYRDVTLSAGVDHALLRNLLLSAKASHIKRSPIEKNDRLGQGIIQITFDGAYQADRYTTVSLNIGYGRGRPTTSAGSIAFDELRGQASIQLKL